MYSTLQGVLDSGTLLPLLLIGLSTHVSPTVVTRLSHAANKKTRNVPTSITATAAPAEFGGAVCLPDYYPKSPKAWFCSISETFAASRVTRSLTKFQWALSKLPFMLIDSIGQFCRNPSAYADPYQELQDILLLSYSLSGRVNG